MNKRHGLCRRTVTYTYIEDLAVVWNRGYICVDCFIDMSSIEDPVFAYKNCQLYKTGYACLFYIHVLTWLLNRIAVTYV